MTPDHGFRIDLDAAMLCLDIECNTVFDRAHDRICPNCGGAGWSLAVWLNRRAWPTAVRAEQPTGRLRVRPLGAAPANPRPVSRPEASRTAASGG